MFFIRVGLEGIPLVETLGANPSDWEVIEVVPD